MKHQTICGIYKVTNKENGKAYIGQSIDILTRWNQHLWHSEKDDLSFIFSNALKKTFTHFYFHFLQFRLLLFF